MPECICVPPAATNRTSRLGPTVSGLRRFARAAGCSSAIRMRAGGAQTFVQASIWDGGSAGSGKVIPGTAPLRVSRATGRLMSSWRASAGLRVRSHTPLIGMSGRRCYGQSGQEGLPLSRRRGALGAGPGVANVWQDDQRHQSATNDHQRVCAGQDRSANDDRERPLSVPRFPWYY